MHRPHSSVRERKRAGVSQLVSIYSRSRADASAFRDKVDIRFCTATTLVEKGITLEDLRVLLKKSEALETVH